MAKSDYGTRIKRERERLGLTQDALAKALKTDRKTVNRWETGRRGPEAANLEVLARTLGCTADYLLGLELPDDGVERGRLAERRALALRLRQMADELDDADATDDDAGRRRAERAAQVRAEAGPDDNGGRTTRAG